MVMSSNTPAIAIRGVTKTFGPKFAVKDLDLTVPVGALCGFIGPNGAGKTTTIRMIMSIIFPDRGEISVLGKASAVESKDRIGYLPEERGVYRKMKVGAFLNYIARLKGVDGGASDRKVKDWLARVGLAESYRKKCEELSKGMQQKVQFIAAVINEPDMLILDEVFSGLDPVNRRLLRELIDEQHRAGRTIIFSTHAMFEAEQLCDQIFMIHQGVKVLDGSLTSILAKFDAGSLIVEPVDPDSERALRAIPCVQDVLPSPASGQQTFEVVPRPGFEGHAAIAMIAAALPVRRLELKRVSLEEVFIDRVLGAGASSGTDRERLREQLVAAGAQEASS